MNRSRRQFLGVILQGLGAFLLLGRWRSAERLLRSGADRWDVAIERSFGSTRSTRRIGEEYLRNMPAERDRARLVDLVLPSEPRHRLAFEVGDRVRRRRLIQEKIRKDFREGRIVRVRGWILSRTEARLYALLTLSVHRL